MSDLVSRRGFVGALGLAAAAGTVGAGQDNAFPGRKREAMLSFKNGGPGPGYVPAAFFLHFDEGSRLGRAAVQKHLEYYRFTGMDFVKVQYERNFPKLPQIKAPADWKAMPRYGIDFYRPQLEVVDGLVKAAGHEALVIVTLYSAFMCAGHSTSRAQLVRDLEQDGEAVRPGLEAITDSLLVFVRECRDLGVDGFYASTQGGEAGTFRDPALFARYVTPCDLRLMRELEASFAFNVLHVCDYEAPYADLAPFTAYPGHLVSCSGRLTTAQRSLSELATLFGRPILGGMDRKGVIAGGSNEEIRRAAEEVLKTAPPRFILGADCTVPGEKRWEGIRTAIATAHAFRRS
ncbi:MAG TPA: uroporphyrinogen decarboxylase family protein [Vicinamibacteria bacterium]|nr:uroporphyrinogen decarboxylase family protein [Vicinamibacteria bacterium]